MKSIFTLALVTLPAFAAFPNGYSYCKVVTTQHTMVSGTNDLANYPLTVILTDADLRTTGNGGLVNNTNGYDIGFYPDCSGSGTSLKWEMESYDPTTGAIVAHVLRPALSHTTDDTIGIYYGGSFTSFQSTASAVWTADGHYKGIFHLTSLTADSLGINTLTNTSVTTAIGKMGGGATFSAASLANSSPTGIPNTFPATLELWIKPTSVATTQYLALISKYSGTAPSLFSIALGPTSGALYQYQNLNTRATAGSVVAAGAWSHIVIEFLGTTSTVLYVNGAPVTIQQPNGAYTLLGPQIYLGSLEGAAPFGGIMDEVRISDSSRSADWVLTEFRNQGAPGTYMSAGPRLTGAGPARVRHRVTGDV